MGFRDKSIWKPSQKRIQTRLSKRAGFDVSFTPKTITPTLLHKKYIVLTFFITVRMMKKSNLERGHNFEKRIPCLTHFHNSCLLPQPNYNVINFVNNNYIFHDRILSKGRCKTLS